MFYQKKFILVFRACLLITLSIFFISSCAATRFSSESAGSKYQPDMAEVLVKFSDFAYIKKENKLIETMVKNYPNYRLLRKIGENETGCDTQGFVAYSNDAVIVSIRGSENPITTLDWVNNAKMFHYTNEETKAYCKGFAVHGGFHLSALKIKDIEMDDGSSLRVHEKISLLQKEGRKVYFTGHSLGGAISNMLAFFMAYETETAIEGIYTFGEPIAGNTAYKECHDKKLLNKTFRFVNNRDGVARIHGFGDYEHVGNLIYFDTNGAIHDINTYDPITIIRDTILLKFATDHKLNNYAKAIEKIGVSIHLQRYELNKEYEKPVSIK